MNPELSSQERDFAPVTSDRIASDSSRTAIRRGVMPLLLSAMAASSLAAQRGPANHIYCRRFAAGENVTPAAAIRAKAGGADFLAGCQAIRNREWSEAAKAFERAVTNDSASAVYRLWLGRARAEELKRANPFRQVSLLPTVRNDITSAVQLDSTFIDARIYQIEMMLLTPAAFGGSVENAASLAATLRKQSHFFGTLAESRVRIAAGDTTAAVQDLKSLIRAHPDSFAPYVALLNLQFAAKHTPDAAVTLAGLRKRPALRTLADFYVGQMAATTGQGTVAGAAAIRRYVSQVRPYGYPQRALSHWHLAKMLEKDGKTAAAIAELESALRLNPDLERAKEDLRRLKGA